MRSRALLASIRKSPLARAAVTVAATLVHTCRPFVYGFCPTTSVSNIKSSVTVNWTAFFLSSLSEEKKNWG